MEHVIHSLLRNFTFILQSLDVIFTFLKGQSHEIRVALNSCQLKVFDLDIWRLICGLFINSIWFLMDLWSFYAKRLQNRPNFPFKYFFSKDNWGCFIERLIILICSTHIRKVPLFLLANQYSSWVDSFWLIPGLVYNWHILLQYIHLYWIIINWLFF